MAKKDELNFETDNKMASSEKLKALQATMEKIEKNFGKGSIMKMGDDSVEQVEVCLLYTSPFLVAVSIRESVESTQPMQPNIISTKSNIWIS